MSHGVAYLYWRNGRPRWEPGPTRRRKGQRGQDLKDKNGNWLTLEDAKIAAQKINDQIGIMPRAEKQRRVRGEKSSIAKVGFIYFIRSGDAVKIGWTKHPFERMNQMLTGNPLGFSGIIAIRAQPQDELALHRACSAHRIQGEWFRAEPPVLALMESFGKRASALYQNDIYQMKSTYTDPLILNPQSANPTDPTVTSRIIP
jgi:T5orf172 domain